MKEIFTSDVKGTYTRSLEIFLPYQQLFIKATIDRVEGNSKSMRVIVSGVNSQDGKNLKGVHAARFLRYIAERYNEHELTRLCQCYCMIFKGSHRLEYDLSTTTFWPTI